MSFLEELTAQAAEQNASDIHLASGLAPRFRIDGQLCSAMERVLSAEECTAIAEELAGAEFDAIRKRGELDLAKTISARRVRVNIYHTRGTISIALRILADRIPKISDLGLPPAVSMFPSYQKGIVLVTGETGSGKSTTLAAILNEINHTRNEHIITLEDPIEYVYEPDRCLISQREIGTDTDSYADGLRAILREDPDIILIGEMRDAETIETALTAAETGHLVFATLHTNSAADSIDRIIGAFSAARQPEIRMQLSTVLMAVLSQQLLVRRGGHGRACACEVMIATPAIRNQIREGKTPQMESSILTSAKEGSLTMDHCLIQMVKNGVIDLDTASSAARKPENIASAFGSMRSSSEYRRI
ncbi:PilT/PilU family type 4a pilus ATPase [Erysipelotrichaceae bacterium Oil+RF-744-GAM-WT-6]|uniref:PilT/PilU family type 4a pilus ATPase n=1 Tax=Stecheria intestinalis TaxID=2606630 RepID=A0A7X2NU53_9FIRM|nr:PilT/PilU family type 4a pilus ATPase [Stecheria intestinalis]MSS59605.1 PilT/PilU family type 4a pilus ATPase [Stecheria intestinalis]